MMRLIKQNPPGSLPKKHFAILFEGAWLFSRDKKDKHKIAATCPLPDDGMHECKFGLWGDKIIDPLKGYTGVMAPGTEYSVETVDFDATQSDFHSLFSCASKEYPCVYIPQQPKAASVKADCFDLSSRYDPTSARIVTVPFPSKIVADGALISAEIDGGGKGQMMWWSLAPRRPVITYVFVYEYTADRAEAFFSGPEGAVGIVADVQSPTPHLIFNVHPDPAPKPTLKTPVAKPNPIPTDDAAQKCHIANTFETLRQSISNGQDFCDVGVYHDRCEMTYSYGNSGLEPEELGLTDGSSERNLLGASLASCGSGGAGYDGC